MNWSRDWELGVRMAVTLGLLAFITLLFAGVLWGMLFAVASAIISFVWRVFLPVVSGVIGVVDTVLIILILISVELPDETLAARGFSTQPMEKTPYAKQLSQTVERLAQQADLPVPSVVVADSTLPNSYTSGLSPQQATVVVTTGLLEKLEPKEVRAVLAHELAHVKHRDAAVMTVASIPIVMARRLHEWSEEQIEVGGGSTTNGGLDMLLLGVCLQISRALWLVGRLLFRLLSRYRELAADRGAIALTGSPATLANALETVDSKIGSMPREDLRSAHGSIEAFAVVPVETETLEEPIRLGPNGDQIPTHNQYEYLIQKKMAPLPCHSPVSGTTARAAPRHRDGDVEPICSESNRLSSFT